MVTSERRVQAGWPAGRGGIAAGVATGALLVLTTADLGQHYEVPLGGAFALATLRALALASAWLRPTVAVPVSLLGTALTAAVCVPVSPDEAWPWPVTSVFGQAAVLVIVGARGASRTALAVWWAATQVVGVVAMALAPERGTWAGLLTMAVLSAVAVGVADLLRSRAETRRRLSEQETISEGERAQRARLQERARIARELHDVVAHHLSVVVVRADSAPHRLRELPAEVREEFAGIADDARSSLMEMRRVLRLLREDPAAEVDRPTELGPQPGLAELEELVATTRRAGADVRLEVALPAEADPAAELTAYRVAQEAISNAVRHAPGAKVEVAVDGAGDALVLTVANGPSPTGDCAAPGSGHGLVGMRERVGLLDGTFQAGPTSEGGYLVQASIPLNAKEAG
ncbi:signal transduction histidine kinase [Kribbella orskensis]|uniref:histidine kinase n=1 Tax=Kribbella orskensis TaxID=2512216 RepID=A0ABY2BAM2_9ACTN|nr:signal transduction histidine kinase [Kribbella sp. VKM Ac-2500]TCO13598.1 signal transduction histidine kinase [Kribbella orskensis]